MLELLRSTAAAYGQAGIWINAILPGATSTPMLVQEFDEFPDLKALVEGAALLNRVAPPEEIAQVALWLLSEGASFVTGAAIALHSGLSRPFLVLFERAD
ncbi:hypothetical protein C1T17_12355 [Sphingobium sp. SCG-1]|nr:hypothetical protein C1T17_12355 [Sphingobium sp. SCG-1]